MELSKKPRNPHANVGGTGYTSKGGVTYTADGNGFAVMRKGKTARERARRAKR